MYDWLINDDYDHNYQPNTISATSLLKPIRVLLLTQRHGDKFEIDASELIASKYGNAIHDSIERIQTPGVSKEERIRRTINVSGVDYTVTGKYDLLVKEGNNYTLRDIKSTSVWAQIHGGKDEDYRGQLSIYKWLLSPEKTINDIAYIDFYFTDWQSSKAKMEENYPKHRIHAGHKIDLLPLELTEKAIRNKIANILLHQDTPDNDLPECTRKELWQTDDSWAVYKEGNKKASKVCKTLAEAEEYQNNRKIEGSIQHRPGEVKRCKYCPAIFACNQAQRFISEGLLQIGR